MPDPERLWSPWRMEHIRRRDSGQSDGCLLCDAPVAGEDEANHLRAMKQESSPNGFNRA